VETSVKNQPAPTDEDTSIGRRNFIKGTGAVAAVAMAASALPIDPQSEMKKPFAETPAVPYNSKERMLESFDYRVKTAIKEKIDVGVQGDNGDTTRFTDFSGNYCKALQHGALGIPNYNSFNSMRRALYTGRFEDFERMMVGTPGGGANSQQNGPQGAIAYDLVGLDSHASIIPAAPGVSSNISAAEAVEHYWAALLQDVPFTQYATNPLVAQAVDDMNGLSFLRSRKNYEFPFPVTPQNLFRGQFYKNDGNVTGPFVSQFMLQPTFMGPQPISQQVQTFLPNQYFMTSVSEYQLVQNGGDSGLHVLFDPSLRYLRNGHDLASYTWVDVLSQAYFIAFLVLSEIGVPVNPGNPYIGSRTEKPFGTLGSPDCAGTLTEVATRALKAAWFHKWIKDLRLRPEEYGALIQTRLTNASPLPQAADAIHPDMLNSAVLPIIRGMFGSYLLPQAFPEGSPTHPCYPTGHGTVGGACITVLKFFFDCNQKIRPLLNRAGRDVVVSSTDGLFLDTYTGADADELSINGELSKLAFNVTSGHGIHAGIHFRSSSYWSVLLGEQVALSVLRDRAKSYNEPFSITITKFDGTTATISNTRGHCDSHCRSY
jgi:hypothetical protein